MAKAMAQRWRRDPTHLIKAAAPSLSTDILEKNLSTTADNLEVLPNADLLVLAVKPQQLPEVIAQIKPHLREKSLIVSIAAGIELAWLDHHLPHMAIVRAMPNLGAAVGQAATPLIANIHVTSGQQRTVEILFQQLGITTWVPEDAQMDAFTALSGCGPAYVYVFVQAMQDAAIAMGIDAHTAETFTLQTVTGALALLSSNNASAAEWQARVTSPKGATAAALEVLTTHGFRETLQQAMQAAAARARALHQPI
jgi:pyrroline-5-carboxylate reductase